MKRFDDATIAGAIFDFAGYLTTREEDFMVGSHSHSGEIVNHIIEFLKSRNIDSTKADVENWTRRGITSNSIRKIFLRNRNYKGKP